MYKLFSRRRKEASGDILDVYICDSFSPEFRNQFFHIVSDIIDTGNAYAENHCYPSKIDWWELTCELFSREKGLKCLPSPSGHPLYRNSKLAYELYVDKSDNEDFLDLLDFSVQAIFQAIVDAGYVSAQKEESAIEELNFRFKQHSLGYEIIEHSLFVKTDEHLHTNVVKPALGLLHLEEFSGAEEEFFVAWDHFKKGNKKDAILNAAKAFESVMKCICKQMKYPYDEKKDDAKKLIQILRENEFFPSYLESQMNGIRTTLESGLPTVRNKLAGHGQGDQIVQLSDAYVVYAMNLTATNIVFLCNLYKERRNLE